MTPYTFQQFVTESFAKMDGQVQEMIAKGEDTEALLAVTLGNLQGVLEHLAKRIDELAIPT